MSITQLITESIQRLEENQEVQKIVDNAVKKSLENAIDGFFRYGEFRQMLEEAVKKSFGLNGVLDLPSYNEQILSIVRRQVESHTRETIEKQVSKDLIELLAPPPENIKLSDLIEQYKSFLKKDRDGNCVCDGDDHFFVKISDRDCSLGTWTIRLSKQKEERSRRADIEISVWKDGTIYHLCFDGQVLDSLYSSKLYGFEKSLFQMKAAKTSITKDVDDEYEFDTYIGNDHY